VTDVITYIGHATTLLEIAGKRFLTDPMLANRLLHIRRVVSAPELDALQGLDGVLVSHAHMDHLHLPSLRLVAAACPVVVPRGCGQLLTRAGIADVTEIAAGESIDLDGVEITATPALHDARRWPLGKRTPTLGFVVGGTTTRVYFAGDTDLFDGMRELAGSIDVALLPVAGWGAHLPAGHLDPPRAVEALVLLEPRIAVPIHWGTLASGALRRLGDLQGAPQEFALLAAERVPEVDVRVLQPGESLRM
jgi:L-ascorbate metabolism protein UlaG (beta-lactamase superfamily)